MNCWRALITVLLTIAAGPAAGQVLFEDPPVDPAAPVANELVRALLVSNSFTHPPIAVRRSGFEIDLEHTAVGCPITCVVWHAVVDLGRLPAGTYTMRTIDVSDAANPHVDDEVIFTVAGPVCGGLCLLGARFTVAAEWTTATGLTGNAHPLPMTDVTGAFWFFGDENVELVVKVLDACQYNGRFWFFAAGLTDVDVDIVVTDNLTGAQRRYSNPIGRPFQPINDTQAFACP